MSVQVELTLKVRDDEDPHPHVETTGCLTDAANAIEGMTTAVSDVLLRAGFTHAQMILVVAEFVDLTFPEDDDNPAVFAAEQEFRLAAGRLVKAWSEFHAATAPEEES